MPFLDDAHLLLGNVLHNHLAIWSPLQLLDFLLSRDRLQARLGQYVYDVLELTKTFPVLHITDEHMCNILPL